MKQLVTQGIILSRTNFGEADRIISVLTPDHGKLRLMAKGVRKVKSKLAGGIELFSVSDLTFIPGKGEIGTLISSRMQRHFGQIVKNLDRVQLGYDLIKQLDKATADHPEPAYFTLLLQALEALDDATIELQLIRLWFAAQLLRLAGHTPNLRTDTVGDKLLEGQIYAFDYELMAFKPQPGGPFSAAHIRGLRLLFEVHRPEQLSSVQGLSETLPTLAPIISSTATELAGS